MVVNSNAIKAIGLLNFQGKKPLEIFHENKKRMKDQKTFLSRFNDIERISFQSKLIQFILPRKAPKKFLNFHRVF